MTLIVHAVASLLALLVAGMLIAQAMLISCEIRSRSSYLFRRRWLVGGLFVPLPKCFEVIGHLPRCPLQSFRT
jgi:hypothetical protein